MGFSIDTSVFGFAFTVTVLHCLFLYFVIASMEHFQHSFYTGRSGGVDAPASGGGPDSFCFQSILLINHCIQQGFGRTSLSIWTCHCLFAGLGLGFVLFQYHLPRCLQTLQFSCVASPAASDSDCTDLDLQLDLGDMDMDDSDGDWTFISQPTPKQKSTPKQVPAYCARNAVSLQQPLQKGGKAVPPFCRPASLTVPVPSVGSSTRQLDSEVSLQLHTSANLPSKCKNTETRSFPAPRGGSSKPVAAQSSTIPAELVARWMILVNSVGALSTIWRDYHQSIQFDVHCRRLLEKFAPSTLFKYINTLQCIHSILLEFAWTWHDIGRHHLSDLLQIAHEGKHTEWGFGATTAIKALRWAQKLLLISDWQMLHDPIVNSFFNSSNHERRESVPLSLFLISQWERRILMKECSLQEQILLGGFLCLLWGGLRFADGQRVSLQSLSWYITALRGSCYRTKTSRSGQPWAIQARGFLSHGTWSWVAQWLMALDILWSRAHNAVSDADFCCR